ncbi:MAG: hypothetical protein MHPSP_001104 [Paramarteilia canceri]
MPDPFSFEESLQIPSASDVTGSVYSLQLSMKSDADSRLIAISDLLSKLSAASPEKLRKLVQNKSNAAILLKFIIVSASECNLLAHNILITALICSGESICLNSKCFLKYMNVIIDKFVQHTDKAGLYVAMGSIDIHSLLGKLDLTSQICKQSSTKSLFLSLLIHALNKILKLVDKEYYPYIETQPLYSLTNWILESIFGDEFFESHLKNDNLTIHLNFLDLLSNFYSKNNTVLHQAGFFIPKCLVLSIRLSNQEKFNNIEQSLEFIDKSVTFFIDVSCLESSSTFFKSQPVDLVFEILDFANNNLTLSSKISLQRKCLAILVNLVLNSDDESLLESLLMPYIGDQNTRIDGLHWILSLFHCNQLHFSDLNGSLTKKLAELEDSKEITKKDFTERRVKLESHLLTELLWTLSFSAVLLVVLCKKKSYLAVRVKHFGSEAPNALEDSIGNLLYDYLYIFKVQFCAKEKQELVREFEMFVQENFLDET